MEPIGRGTVQQVQPIPQESLILAWVCVGCFVVLGIIFLYFFIRIFNTILKQFNS
jgi:hypothetical protein